jgi:glycosyltransferase involved in cell wall biosynthesis
MGDIKYSIVLPAYNGMPYLETAVSSVLSNTRNDFELIVSDDHSSDGSLEYLESIKDSRLKLLKAPTRLSMAEHWEWALSHSTGSWVMFLGQDDALQGYFFEHADTLTEEAVRRSLRVIAARRSYIFWPGCEADFPQRVQYFATNINYVRRTRVDCFSSLFLGKKYHELPQMYTNSLFHMSLIQEAKAIQEGRVFTCHPQDANLAALAILFEKEYLRSEIPLGWVGTSPSSAGLAIAKGGAPDSESAGEVNTKLADDYSRSIFKSDLEYPKFAGEFWLANEGIYLWQALVTVSERLDPKLSSRLRGRLFLAVIFGGALAENFGKWRQETFLQAFRELLRINRVGEPGVWVVAALFRALYGLRKLFRILAKLAIAGGRGRLAGVAGLQISTQESSQINVSLLNRSTTVLFENLVIGK